MQGMQQQQMISPSQIDPMMINHTVPYQQNQNIIGMNPNNLLSSQQMIEGLSNFSGVKEIGNNLFSGNIPSNPNVAGLNNGLQQTPPGVINQNNILSATMGQAPGMGQIPVMNGMSNPQMNQSPNFNGILNFTQ